jgi:hypothetical protein
LLPPRSDLAGNPLLVQHEQTAHPLCMDGQCGLRHCWLQKVGFGKLPAAFSLTAAAAAVRGQWQQFRHHHRRGHQPRASWSGGASSLLEASKWWHCSGSTTSIPGCSHRQPGWRWRPGAGWARNGESAANVLSCHRRLCAAHLRPLRPLRIPASPPLLRLLAASFLHRSRRARWLRVFGGRGGGSGGWRSVCPICSEWW